MFRNTLKTIGQTFFSSKTVKKAQTTVSFFNDMKKDPSLVEEMKIMRTKFDEVRSNPDKYNLREIEIDPKEIEKTEDAIKNSRKHSVY